MVLSLGRPGRTARARLGLLSAVAEGWRTPGGAEIERYIEIDTGPAVGFSGGPVVDVKGAVLGMRTSGLLRRTALALPALTVRRVVETLVTHGRVRRGYLGIGTHPVRLPGAVRQDAGRDTGLLLLSVEPGSPAEQAGLLLGDVVLRFGETAVGQADDLLGLLSADRIGIALPAQVLRAGAVRVVNVVIGERR
jgi:S1-C subfamily serine protease